MSDIRGVHARARARKKTFVDMQQLLRGKPSDREKNPSFLLFTKKKKNAKRDDRSEAHGDEESGTIVGGTHLFESRQ